MLTFGAGSAGLPHVVWHVQIIEGEQIVRSIIMAVRVLKLLI